MPESFDPYHRWLGIPPKDQPPNHYRLLGIDPLESDPDVIESAADRQMAHVRTFQAGQHPAEAQQILNRIAAAKLTLLSPQKKAPYDRSLMSGAKGQGVSQPGPQPPAPAAEFDGIRVGDVSVSSGGSRGRRSKPAWQNRIVVGSGALGLIVVAALLYALNSGDDPQVSDREVPKGDPVVDQRPQPPNPVAKKPEPPPDDRPPQPEQGKSPPKLPTPPPKQPDAPTEKPAPLPENPKPPRDPPAPPPKETPPKEDPSIETATDGPVDLLALIDPQRDAVSGRWRFEGRTLVTEAGERVRLQVPYAPPDRYLLTMAVERTRQHKHLSDLCVGLVIGGRQTMLVIDGWFGATSGLHRLDGKTGGENQSTRKGRILTTGQSHLLVFAVDRSGLRVTCDGRAVFDWRGDPRRLSMSLDWAVPDRTQLLLGHWNSDFSISRLELRPLGLHAPATPPAEPVPAEADRQKAERQIREIFSREYAAASRSEAKASLAGLLWKQAGETPDDPLARYVLLSETLRLAAEAGEVLIACDALRALETAYRVDVWESRLAILSQLSRTAHDADARREVARCAADSVSAAIRADCCQEAEQLAAVALELATRIRSVELRKEARDLQTQARALARAWKGLQPALETLRTQAEDPEANLAVGKYYCFAKADWTRGLPHLAKGSDAALAALAALAKADLDGPDQPTARVELAERWWGLVESLPASAEKQAARSRAGTWYGRGLPGLTGLQKARVEKRLLVIGRLLAKAPPAAWRRPQPGEE